MKLLLFLVDALLMLGRSSLAEARKVVVKPQLNCQEISSFISKFTAMGQKIAELVKSAQGLVPEETRAHTLRHTFARSY